jgi:putative transposase
VCVIDCCKREITGWNLSLRCPSEEAIEAVEQSVLARLPGGSREAELTLTTDNGTQFTSTRYMETLSRLDITHRRTACHHPEGNSHIERFHRSMEEARTSIGKWNTKYNHDRPHQSLQNRTPHEAFLARQAIRLSEAPNV